MVSIGEKEESDDDYRGLADWRIAKLFDSNHIASITSLKSEITCCVESGNVRATLGSQRACAFRLHFSIISNISVVYRLIFELLSWSMEAHCTPWKCPTSSRPRALAVEKRIVPSTRPQATQDHSPMPLGDTLIDGLGKETAVALHALGVKKLPDIEGTAGIPGNIPSAEKTR
ncbi:hypothetical protein AC579_4544 [Pseudocercospora musae]|uniref:Uncharacterized protein n=1 Tax=Pseudocercospora musae TaxID=113226 RepID=A0A139ITP5_9PEZI|nr:hypothetical protein AC579_4544 [Pseudocercospora musae]